MYLVVSTDVNVDPGRLQPGAGYKYWGMREGETHVSQSKDICRSILDLTRHCIGLQHKVEFFTTGIFLLSAPQKL